MPAFLTWTLPSGEPRGHLPAARFAAHAFCCASVWPICVCVSCTSGARARSKPPRSAPAGRRTPGRRCRPGPGRSRAAPGCSRRGCSGGCSAAADRCRRRGGTSPRSRWRRTPPRSRASCGTWSRPAIGTQLPPPAGGACRSSCIRRAAGPGGRRCSRRCSGSAARPGRRRRRTSRRPGPAGCEVRRVRRVGLRRVAGVVGDPRRRHAGQEVRVLGVGRERGGVGRGRRARACRPRRLSVSVSSIGSLPSSVASVAPRVQARDLRPRVGAGGAAVEGVGDRVADGVEASR